MSDEVEVEKLLIVISYINNDIKCHRKNRDLAKFTKKRRFSEFSQKRIKEKDTLVM